MADPRSAARNLQGEPDRRKPQETPRATVPTWWHHVAPFLWGTIAGQSNSNQPVAPLQEAWGVEGSTLLPLPEVTGLSQSHPPSPNCCRRVHQLLLPLHAAQFLYPRRLRKLHLYHRVQRTPLWEWLPNLPTRVYTFRCLFPYQNDLYLVQQQSHWLNHPGTGVHP